MSKRKTVPQDRKTRRLIARMEKLEQLVVKTNAVKQATTSAAYWSTGTNSLSSSVGAWASTSGGAKHAKSSPPQYMPPLTGDVFMTPHTVDELHWHIDVFQKLHPEIVCVEASPTSHDEQVFSKTQIGFTNVEDRDFFNKWIEQYLTKFGGDTDNMIPLPTDGTYPHTVTYGTADTADTLDNNELLTKWIWLMENCEGEVRKAGQVWFFALQSDAALFKLSL